MNPIRATDGGVLITLHVQPRAKTSAITGLHGDAIKLRIAAPPVDGAANDEVVRFLAWRLKVPRGRISIVAGHTGRRKTVSAIGVTAEQAATALIPATQLPR